MTNRIWLTCSRSTHTCTQTHWLVQEHMVHHVQPHWQPEHNAWAHDAYAWSRGLAHLVGKQQWFHYIAEIIRAKVTWSCVCVCSCVRERERERWEARWISDSEIKRRKKVFICDFTVCAKKASMSEAAWEDFLLHEYLMSVWIRICCVTWRAVTIMGSLVIPHFLMTQSEVRWSSMNQFLAVRWTVKLASALPQAHCVPFITCSSVLA